MGGRRKMLLSALLLLALTVPTWAECPNGCSGNGACMAKDMCKCYKNYQGNDCLDRTCQFGYAHADTPKGDIDMDQDRKTPGWILTDSQQAPAGTYEYFSPDAEDHEAHFYMECSNKGLCDRSLGTCTCFDGYEGVACQRAACPNKCSGHGTCESIRELGLKAPGTLFGIPDNADQITYDLWDSRVTYGCRCDPWYHGADCSLRSCKIGVDPMFLSVGSATYETFALHVWLDATDYSAVDGNGDPAGRTASANDYLRLRLFDYHGEAYITDAIPIVSDVATWDTDALTTAPKALKLAQQNADAVAAAIKKIPNQTFRDVLCEPTGLNVGEDLAGYTSTRTAATHGLSVVCQFTENPGRLRAPEVVTYNFDGVVNPAKKYSKIYTMENGMDDEWFTVDSKITYVSIDNDPNATPTYTVVTVTNPDGIATEANPTLFKFGPHVFVGKLTATTTITLTYPTKHTLSTTSNRFNVATGSGFAVAELTVAAAVAVGSSIITVTTNPAFTSGQLVFFENQFYKPQKVTGSASPWSIYLDRPFSGNTLDGTANSVLKVYKVTPPSKEFQYNYVSPCSGRGLCGTETGVCACFKGYTNDNCDTQNILAL
ncbi:unnamed protein product [Phytophthora lilii]|uniref:Unnamed protein product n=1 Tax=Phytophthora lilii TaxID=2077276 RepID=A0A9W6TGL9_9STRA|nr:unnamed protein product [Phytophthora lilii]